MGRELHRIQENRGLKSPCLHYMVIVCPVAR